MKTHELRACPGCGAEGSRRVVVGAQHELRRCTTCTLVFAPAYADPDEVYVDGYLTSDGPFGANYGFDYMHPHFQEFLAFSAHVRLELVERTLSPPGRFLDVGCGSGEVLAVARARGWTTHGAEPVADSAHRAREERGLEVVAAYLEESGLPQRTYDVVSAFHVLEHVTDGRSFLRSIARWARPGGYVVVEVPNWASVNRRATGGSWIHLRPLEHVAHYTPATLAATLRRAGLEPVRVATPSFLWPKQTLDQALASLGISRFDRWARRARVLDRRSEVAGQPAVVPSRAAWAALRALQGVYSATRTGMVVLAVARVPGAEPA